MAFSVVPFLYNQSQGPYLKTKINKKIHFTPPRLLNNIKRVNNYYSDVAKEVVTRPPSSISINNPLPAGNGFPTAFGAKNYVYERNKCVTEHIRLKVNRNLQKTRRGTDIPRCRLPTQRYETKSERREKKVTAAVAPSYNSRSRKNSQNAVFPRTDKGETVAGAISPTTA